MSNKAEPTVRWGVTITMDYGNTRVRGHSGSVYSWQNRREALGCASRFGDECVARLVKLTRKPKPKVVRVKTMTWRDDGSAGHVGGPGQYWIHNFLRDEGDIHHAPGTPTAATYRITIEELKS